MSSLLNEPLFPLGNARRELIPRAPSGNPISAPTLWRWINRGLSLPGGGRVKLKVIQCGGRPYVSRIAVEEFFETLTSAREASSSQAELVEDQDSSGSKC
ncbi:hypothetical protein OAE80_01940 [Planctomycetaceae bacterium]|nr:hypothetical protein [Planctomycetaceae bacterium]